jgi:hypothetical protein
MRESRTRRGQPGTSWSDKERQSWEVDTINFLKRKADVASAICSKAKHMKQEKDDMHIASWDHYCSWEHMTSLLTTRGLDQFLDPPNIGGLTIPRSLFICMDFEQVQWRVLWFLRNHCGLNIEGMLELTHRRQRDLELASTEAGLSITIQKVVVCCNAKYGPWQGQTFFQDALETAKDLSQNMHEDDYVLLHYWPRIIKDKSLLTDMQGAAGRKSVIEGLADEDCFRTKGEKCSKGKWCSVQAAWIAGQDNYVGIELVVLTHLALRRGWIRSVDDLTPSSSKCDVVPVIPSKSTALAIHDDPAVAVVGGAGSSGDPVAAPAVAPKAKAKPKAKASSVKALAAQDIKDERKGTANTLHYVMKAKYDQEFVNSARMFCAITAPECSEHSHYVSQVLGAADTKQYFADLAAGGYMKPLVAMLEVCSDVVVLDRCGFICELAGLQHLTLDSPEVFLEDARSQKFLSFVIGILRHRVSSCAWHSSSYPGALAALVDKDSNKVQAGLRRFKRHVLGVQFAETCGPTGVAMAGRSMLKSSLMEFCIQMGMRVDFKVVNGTFRQFLNEMFEGGLQSVINEKLNKDIRDQEQRASSSHFSSRVSRWSACQQSGLIEAYERKPVAVPHCDTSFGEVDASSIFSVPATIESVLPGRLLCGSNTWKTFNSMTIKRELHGS